MPNPNQYTDIDSYYYSGNETLYVTEVKGKDFHCLLYIYHDGNVFKVYRTLTDYLSEDFGHWIALFHISEELDRYLETFSPTDRCVHMKF